MVLDNDWGIPLLNSIDLSEEEFLLLDWVICSGSQLIPGASLEELVTNWSSFRSDVWQGLSAIIRFKKTSPNVPHVEPLNVDDFLVRTLLAIVPTTFRWGTGADCGYELKLKLYRFLSKEGELDDNSQDQTDSNSEDKPTSSAGSDA